MARSENGPSFTLTADIEKRYSDGTTVAAAFTLPSDPPQLSIVFGPSGAGKTTLLRCVAGLEKLTAGQIQYGNEIWSDARNRNWVPPQKRSVGYLFQDFALFPHLSVRGNIAFGLGSLSRAERRSRVDAVCSQLGLEGLGERRPRQLSGGEQQRVALARVLVRRPRLLLLDEPFAALDEGTREEVRSYLVRLLRTLGIPALVVTHDWIDALTLGDEMIVISQGRMLQTGPPREVLTRPAGPEVAAVVGVETVVEGTLERSEAGTASLEVGSTRLVGVDPGGTATSYWVCIRGEDVTLEHGTARKSTARNHLQGRVVGLSPKGPLTKVEVDVGFPLVALVTRQAALDLDLGPGNTVSAVFKASIIHLIPREERT